MSYRHFRIFGMVFVAGVAAWGALFAEDRDQHADESAITIQRLQDRLAALEKRIEVLEDQQTGVHPAAGVIFSPPLTSPSDDRSDVEIPPTWKQGEINGLRFYTIPLGKQNADD